MRRVSSSISDDTYARLEDVANIERGSVAQIIRRSIEELISRYGELPQPGLALRRHEP